MNRASPSPLALHCLAAFIGASALAIAASGDVRQTIADLTREQIAAQIAVEHGKPLALTVVLSRIAGGAIVEIGQDGTETIFLSVPDVWIRREVRGTALSDTTADAPGLGFLRYRLPAGAVISFRAGAAPDTVALLNPSAVPIKVRTTLVDTAAGTAEEDVRLAQAEEIVLFSNH